MKKLLIVYRTEAALVKSIKMVKFNKQGGLITLLFFLGVTILNGQIINVEDRRHEATRDSLKWLGHIGVGANLTKNNSKVFVVAANAQFERFIKKHLIMSITNYNLVKINGNKFINEGFQHFRYNYQIKPKLAYEVLAQAQSNKLANIDLRILVGTGLRYRIFKIEKDQGFLGATYLYEYEEEAIADFTHRDHRLSTYFSFAWHPHKNVKIGSTTYFQPLFDDWKDYRLSTQSNVVLSITSQFSLNIGITYVYDKKPAIDAPETLYKFSNGLRISF